MLFESIRTFGGRLARAPIYAVAPRPGLGVGWRTRSCLHRLGVEYVERRLNVECPEYGSANRVYAAAHVEEFTSHEIVVVLDSDTIFLREPTALHLPETDLAVRPVDVKGMCTSGPDDPNEAYWLAFSRVVGCGIERLPWIESFVDAARVRASYNGGLVAVRRDRGIFRRWAEVFTASLRAGLAPSNEPFSLRSSTGMVEPAASRLWGSNQAALAFAAWSGDDRVQVLDSTYNYPLHSHWDIPVSRRVVDFSTLVHVHYHWLGEPAAIDRNPLLADASTLPAATRRWLRARLPFRASE